MFDFNGNAPPAGVSFSGTGAIYSQSVTGAAQPAGDTTPFLATGAGASGTFTSAPSLTSFSVSIGSVDHDNFLEFTGKGDDSGKFSPARPTAAISSPSPPAEASGPWR